MSITEWRYLILTIWTLSCMDWWMENTELVSCMQCIMFFLEYDQTCVTWRTSSRIDKGIIMQQLSNCVLFLDNWFGFCEAFCNVENEQAYKAREQGCRGPALGQFLFCKYLSCNYETSRNHRLVELRYVSHCNIEYTTVLFNLLLFLSPSNSNSYAFEYWACYCYNKLEMHQQHSIFQVLD